MLQKILLLTVIAVVYCQYPEQRAPPMRYREEYDDYDAPPPPRRAPPPQQSFAQNARPAPTHKPASVHYVNIGLELAGDYKFGYDTGKNNDGQSFREETRLPDGTVQGAYGYVDETGTQRIVKYTAGKDGFKVEGDPASERVPKSAPREAAAPAPAQPAYRPPPPAQPAYRPPPQAQPAYRPQPAQAAYTPQPAPRPAPQQAPRPQPQPAYRPPPPPPPQPQPRPAYRAQPAYSPEPEYAPRPRAQSRPRPAPRPVESYDSVPDYDYPTNEIGERRLAPVDTSLFNYNIGTSQDNKN